MPSAFRSVEIAPGHALRVRLSPRAAAQPGRVVVTNSRRGQIEIDAARWDQGTPA